MELKYPKVSLGIKLMYVNWWCTLLGVVASLAEGYATLLAKTNIIGLGLAAGVLELLMYGLQFVGLYKAAKDEERYKKVYYMLLAELLIGAVVIVGTLLQSYVLILIVGTVGGLACMVLEPLRLCLFVKCTEELVQENGDATRVGGYYKTIRNCFLVAYGGVILGSVIMALEIFVWLGILLIAMAMFSAIGSYIFYGIFLHKTNKYFKTLEKERDIYVFSEN